MADLATLGEYFAQLGAGAASTGAPLDAEQLVGSALRAIPHATQAALTVVGARGRPETWPSGAESAGRIDALAHALDDGPFVRAVGGEQIVRVDDVAVDARCSRFGPRCAAEFGVRSILSVRVAMAGAERAAFSVYAAQPAAFDDVDLATLTVLSPFAGLAVQNAVNARKVGQLEIALQSSRQISTAVGILMSRHLLTGDEAFARMSRASQQLNRKLREIAELVERTGALPGLPPADPSSLPSQ